ncbi:unnamed protein product [Adineta steineri]|uniref:G-protein coupled receptors family 1 profile domain-containing protein n=1 Tax=Adineta steineri TaxID=433720 RepID=A0A813MV03_9BILA|nr:unnamed protein product [Adineta steineri]CAF0848512.1 unnamed protein product [Adineta steineri]
MNITDSEVFVDTKFLLHRVKFSILLILQIPAFILSLLIFFFFIKHRTIREAPHNRALLILLIVNFIQLLFAIPLSLSFYAVGYVSPATPTFCTWWTFFDFTFYVTSEYLMATISIQRHMLVFNGHILRIRWKRILFHHLPLVFCLIYPITFYVFVIILYPCQDAPWDYESNLCGAADCYLVFNKFLGIFDWGFNNGLPMVINALANIMLIVRVVQQKRRQQRPVTWKQQRRMTVQLFCISSLYLVIWSPSLIVGLVQILGFPTFLAEVQTEYFVFILDTICLFLPWICIGLLPELLVWIKTLCHCQQRHNAVGSVITRTQLNK